jgi:hypothetical protein
MSSNEWEQDALDSIKDGLAGSDPVLAARLAMFTRLTSGEAMPMRAKLQAVSRRMVRRRGAGRLYQSTRLTWAMLLVWLVTTTALIATVLVSSRAGSHLSCAGSWGTLCGHTTAAPQPAQLTP